MQVTLFLLDCAVSLLVTEIDRSSFILQILRGPLQAGNNIQVGEEG